MSMSRPPTTVGHAVWFKAALLALFFVPAITQRPYDQRESAAVVQAVLSHPLTEAVSAFNPVAKLLLAAAFALPFLVGARALPWVLGYYVAMLLVVGIFQNIAVTEAFGRAWLAGNTAIQATVAAYCGVHLARGSATTGLGALRRDRLWVTPLMALALLSPNSLGADGIRRPGLGWEVVTNDVALAYCMVTPVVLGVMVLFSEGFHTGVVSVVAWAGLLFGLVNAAVWFVVTPAGWWVGVLHLPLLLISAFALGIARRQRREDLPTTNPLPTRGRRAEATP